MHPSKPAVRALSLVAAVVPALASGALAQSPPGLSLQASAVGSAPFGGDARDVGLGGGWEGQLRVHPSRWSFGLGAEQTWHGMQSSEDKLGLLGVFLEPRVELDVGLDFAQPYLATRVGYSRTRYTRGSVSASAPGFVLNGGGGFLVRLWDRFALDVGASAGIRHLGAPDPVDLGVAFNTIARLGLMVGLGG
jgi:hypothetical protein